MGSKRQEEQMKWADHGRPMWCWVCDLNKERVIELKKGGTYAFICRDCLNTERGAECADSLWFQ